MSSFVPIPIPDSAPPIYAVKIDDNRIGATLRSLCDVLDLARHAQAARIKRDPALAKALVTVLLDSPGGFQKTEVLLSGTIPVWLSGLNISRLPENKQALALYVQQNAVDLIEQAFSKPKNETTASPPPPHQSSVRPSVWQEWHLLGDHLEAEFEGQRRQSDLEQQEVLERLTAVEDEQHNQALRLAVLEAGEIHSTRGSFAERLLYIYLYARQLRARRGMRISETLDALAEHFQVEDISDLPEKDWPAVHDWFTSLLEEW